MPCLNTLILFLFLLLQSCLFSMTGLIDLGKGKRRSVGWGESGYEGGAKSMVVGVILVGWGSICVP